MKVISRHSVYEMEPGEFEKLVDEALAKGQRAVIVIIDGDKTLEIREKE